MKSVLGVTIGRRVSPNLSKDKPFSKAELQRAHEFYHVVLFGVPIAPKFATGRVCFALKSAQFALFRARHRVRVRVLLTERVRVLTGN